MRVAITGGTGFVGGHLAAYLAERGHQPVVVSRGIDRRPWAREVVEHAGVVVAQAGIDDRGALVDTFRGCDAIAHCAGINRELGASTYDAVHVRGTENVVEAAKLAGVERLAIVSFLRARPDCGSAYHESKWAAEEIVRASGLEWTVVKPGMMFGRGDHMIDHLSRAVRTFPVFAKIGNCRVRPLAVVDCSKVLSAALVDGRLRGATVPLLGPTELSFDDAARLVAKVVGRHPLFLPVPGVFHDLLAAVAERVMTVPLMSKAQLRILREELVQPAFAPDELPAGLTPATPFNEESIEQSLPADTRSFGPADFRLRSAREERRVS